MVLYAPLSPGVKARGHCDEFNGSPASCDLEWSVIVIMRFVVVPVFAFLFMAHAYAREALDLSGGADFAAQKAKIEAGMMEGGEYGEITPEERYEVRRRLDVIELAMRTSDSPVDGLSPERQVEIFNHQAAVNQVLTKAREDSRVVCTRVRKTGSKFATNRCVTVAQARREREDSRDWSRTLNRTMKPEGTP
jgi:hypothetical protein